METNFVKGMRLDLGELVLHVIGIHGTNLVTRRRSEDLDDLDKLVDAGLSWEQRLAKHELRHDATRRPNICYLVISTNTLMTEAYDVPILVV